MKYQLSIMNQTKVCQNPKLLEMCFLPGGMASTNLQLTCYTEGRGKRQVNELIARSRTTF